MGSYLAAAFPVRVFDWTSACEITKRRAQIMISFQRILFPVDFSPQSSAAAPLVKAMAARFQSEVLLLHIVEVPPAWYGR